MDTSAWRFFPHSLIGALGVVIAVNGYMLYDAITTFPGEAGQDGFDLSNEYSKVEAAVKAQAALGWKVDADVTVAKTPVLTLLDKSGAGLDATEIVATAERPVGPPSTTTLAFKPVGNGRFTADTTLWSGQWDMMLAIKSGGHEYKATRRVVVK